MNTEPCKVLVVDDERGAADSSVELLQLWGHEAEAAYSAEDAIAKAIAFDPDVVLMDVTLPHTNGFRLANELRRYCSTAKFVAITGFTRMDIVRRSRAAGFAQVLLKPTPATVLKETVDTQCATTTSAKAP